MQATAGAVRRGRRHAALRSFLALILTIGGVALPAAAQPPPEEPTAGAPSAANSGGQAEEPARDERLRFELPVSDESGSGTLVVLAEELELEGSVYVLIGNVEIRRQDVKIRADRAELDSETQMVSALGNIILDQGPSRLTGATLSFNLEDKTGSLTQARGYVSTDYYFQGEEVLKTGDVSYSVLRGRFSSCSQDLPAWSFTTKRTNFVVDGYARAKGAALRIKKAPILYFPYLLYPVRSERSSGFLVPKPGFGDRMGTTLGLAYYQTMGTVADATFHLDLSSEDYNAFGTQFRYQTTPGTGGEINAYFIDDPVQGSTRWRTTYVHESTDLPWGFRGVAAYDDVSDFDYFRDFEREVRNNSRRQLYSFGYLSRNKGRQSFNLIVDQRKTLIRTDKFVTQRQLPEVEYQLRATQLGSTPLYFGLRSSFHYLDTERTDVLDASYARINLAPTFTLPVRLYPWLSLAVDAGAIYTRWGDSLYLDEEIDPDAPPSDPFRGESLDRLVPTVQAEIVGPSFSKIFNGGEKTWSKYKHVIEPRFAYTFVDTFDEQGRVPRFDEIDTVRGANFGRISLINRLLAKPVDESSGGAREIMSLELYRFYSFDNDEPFQISSDGTRSSQASPIGLRYRYQPSYRTSLQQEVIYNTLFKAVESYSTSASLGLGRHSIGLRWTARRNAELDETLTNQVRLSTDFELIRNRLRYITGISFDARTSYLQQQRHMLNITGSCWGFLLEYSEWGRQATGTTDSVFRFSVSLKNVGTFLDLLGGQNEAL